MNFFKKKKINKHGKNQDNTTHNEEKKKQSIETKPLLTEILELADNYTETAYNFIPCIQKGQ